MPEKCIFCYNQKICLLLKIKVFDATFCEKDLSLNTAQMSSHPHNHLKVKLLRAASFVLAGEVVLVLRGNSKLEDNGFGLVRTYAVN